MYHKAQNPAAKDRCYVNIKLNASLFKYRPLLKFIIMVGLLPSQKRYTINVLCTIAMQCWIDKIAFQKPGIVEVLGVRIFAPSACFARERM